MSERARRDRGASTALDYVLSLGIAAVLVATLITTGGTFVADQQETSARSELRVIGQQVASDVATADRLVRSTSDPSTIRIERALPQSVSGSPYLVEVSPGSPATLSLSAIGGDVTVEIELTAQTSMTSSQADGGTVVIEYDVGSDTLEVRND